MRKPPNEELELHIISLVDFIAFMNQRRATQNDGTNEQSKKEFLSPMNELSNGRLNKIYGLHNFSTTEKKTIE